MADEWQGDRIADTMPDGADGLATRLSRRHAVLFCAVTFFYWGSLYLYVPILPVYAENVSGSLSMVGIIIASYALCGFAHIASLAIFVGGIAALAPSRIKDLSRLGLRALLAATLACLMTGAIAGLFYTPGSILLGG